MRTIARNLLVSLGILVVLLAPAVGQAAKVSYQAESEQQVLVLLNQIRQQRSLGTLALSTPLRAAARAHSADMLQKSYFDHDSPGETWDTRIARYLRSPMIGENIAWGTGSYGSPEGFVNQWMHSAPHRRIILSADLHRVGLGIAVGTFDGTPGAVMATADFAA
jgi:uncharacterized protein YkwD